MRYPKELRTAIKKGMFSNECIERDELEFEVRNCFDYYVLRLDSVRAVFFEQETLEFIYNLWLEKDGLVDMVFDGKISVMALAEKINDIETKAFRNKI
jgi:hypothetical protein